MSNDSMSIRPLDTAVDTSIPKFNLFFGVLLAVSAAYFVSWGLGYTNHNHIPLFLLATLFGLFMAFNIGGNDVANSFGTSVGAGTLTVKQALLVAAIFEVSGAIIAGGEVTNTIRGGIVDLKQIKVDPMDFVYIMMSALIAAAIWLLFATRKGYPVSTTHSIIGAIVGSSVVLGYILQGPETALKLVQWNKIGEIAISWVLSPVLGGLVAYGLYSLIKRHILAYNESAGTRIEAIKLEKKRYRQDYNAAFERLSDVQKISYTHALTRDMDVIREGNARPEDLQSDYYKGMAAIDQRLGEVDVYRALQVWVPLLAAFGGMIITSMLLFKGLKNMNLGLSELQSYLIMAMIGATIWLATFIFSRTLKGTGSLDRATFLMFSWMQVFTAAGFAFSHGSNDIANAIGPFAAILEVLRTGSSASKAAVPTIAMITFGIALVVGLWFIGKEVIKTVGSGLTELHPASGFAAELSEAAVVMGASTLGLPVSSTHILIGAVMGIGMCNGNANWGLMRPIALAWVITIPAAAALSAIAFYLLRSIFGAG